MSLDRLEKILEYKFNDPKLLNLALTHRSMGMPHNERLEFLGDSILNFIITQELYTKYLKLQEGSLSRMRANLVRQETLGKIAKELQLGDFIILGSGEKKTGGHQRESILSDLLEAVIGAIYLDSDFTKVNNKVISWFKAYIRESENLNLAKQKDAKTRLQEYMQKKKLQLPIYEIVEIFGKDHEQEFLIKCIVDEKLSEPTTAKGSNRRLAEQQAAEKMLERLKK